jgi:FixJ family two-component response regulator
MNESPRVHLVDDDESFLNALSRLLRLEGLETRAFISATALLGSLGPGSRGCVVADLEMPGMTGFELQERLAESSAPMLGKNCCGRFVWPSSAATSSSSGARG